MSDFAVKNSKTSFFLKRILVVLFFLTSFESVSAQTNNWLQRGIESGSMPVKNIDITGDAVFPDMPRGQYEMVEVAPNFYTYKGDSRAGYNFDPEDFQQGQHNATGANASEPWTYYIGTVDSNGLQIRTLYKQTNTDINNPQNIILTGWTVYDPRTGFYREIYNHSLTDDSTELEFRDEFGNADEHNDGGFVRIYKESTEAQTSNTRLAQATGSNYIYNGVRVDHNRAIHIESEKTKFNEDWNSHLKAVAAQKGFTGDEAVKLYTALEALNTGGALTQEQRDIIDRFYNATGSANGVVKLNDGRIVSQARAGGIADTYSPANTAAAANFNRVAETTLDNNGQCWVGITNGFLDVDNCIEQTLYYILGVFAWLVGVSAWIFGMVFNYTVIGMSDFIRDITAIGTVWKVIRDFTNILFIFILLYLAISTILGMNEHGVKHTLSKLIIVAILINFSMFFAKAIVDSANILAISFYQKINPAAKEAELTANNGNVSYSQVDAMKSGGIAGVFMNSLNLQAVYKGNAGDAAAEFAVSPNTGTIFVMGSLTMFIVSCIFLAASVIFIRRLTSIVILIMTSSAAFAGSLLHKTEGMAHEWWEKLIREAFYAPIFLAIIWMALLVLSDPKFLDIGDKTVDQSFFSIGIMVNYIIVINFFIMALVAGEKMGASGASGAMKGYKWLKANIGGRAMQAGFRNTLGRVGFNMLEAKQGSFAHKFQDWRMRAVNGDGGTKGKWGKWTGVNFLTKKLAQNVAPMFDTAFHGMAHGQIAGAGNSFEDEVKERVANMNRYKAENKSEPVKFAKLLLEQTIKGQTNVLEKQIADAAWDEIKDPKEKANLLKYMEDAKEQAIKSGKADPKNIEQINKAINRLLVDRPTGEESDRIRRAMDTEHLQFNAYKVQSMMKEVDDHDPNKVIYDHKKTRDRITELQNKGALNAQETTELNTIRTKYNQKRTVMRQFVSGLTTDQKVNLRRDQIEDEDLADLYAGNDLEQLQRKNVLSDTGYKIYGKVIDTQIGRLNEYNKAYNGDLAAVAQITASMKEHAASVGKDPALLTSTKEVFDYYKENLMKKDKTTARSDNLRKFFQTSGGIDGKKLADEVEQHI